MASSVIPRNIYSSDVNFLNASLSANGSLTLSLGSGQYNRVNALVFLNGSSIDRCGAYLIEGISSSTTARAIVPIRESAVATITGTSAGFSLSVTAAVGVVVMVVQGTLDLV